MIGQTISHFKILETLGGGGMGVVYKARDLKLDREVAIKFLPRQIAADSKERDRFKVEAKAAAALNHPNIATIHAIEEADGETFIVMEYIDGMMLTEAIANGRVTIDNRITYATQIAEGLHAAHKKGIIHRDIKSSNIMLASEGQIKIMDFGLAKIHGAAQLTRVGTTVGTVAYMSPEQIQGNEVDHRSDIWSFGVVLYEMVSGKRPFGGTYEQAVFYSILNQPPPPLPTIAEGVSPDWTMIVNRCLEKDPASRYQSLVELLADLTSTSGTSAAGSTTIPTTSLIPRSNKQGTILLVTAGILALIAIALFGSGRIRLDHIPFFNNIPDEQHLAVLPFTSIGGDSTKQSFCDGLVETMTSKLTQLEQFHESLWVVPASEVRRYKTQSASEARQLFGANLAVTGNLQLLNDMYRLTINLIDANKIRQLKSSIIDINASNIYALQDRSVSEVFEMLNLKLNPKARDLLEAGGTANPGAYEFYLKGVGYLQRYEDMTNLDAAVVSFKRSIEQDSLYALAYAGLGEAYWRKFEAVKEKKWATMAIQECEKAYRLNSRLPEVNVTLGMIHSGTGQYDSAVVDFRRALDADATSAAAYRGLAKAYESKGGLVEAEKTYQKAIALKPDYWGGYNDLGGFYHRHTRYEEAIDPFRRVVDLTPDNYRGYNNLGGIYYYLKRWPDARQMFERSLALKKTSGACSNLGTLYYKEGAYANAARTYETALDLNDKNYLVWGNLAAAYYWAPGEREKAKRAYQHAIEFAEQVLTVNPKDADVLSQLAGYYAMVGERKRSESLIKKALSFASGNSQVMYVVGAAYEQMGNREEALHWIGEAVRNGYSLAEIEHEPELRELMADKRFQSLLQNNKGTARKGK
jgi:serine/threonine protein kinase/Flp pilus assembly protein TadD